MIDANVIKAITDLAQQAVAPTVLPIPGEPAGTYGLLNPKSQTLDIRRAASGDRRYTLLRLDQVHPTIKRWGGGEAKGKTVVFVSSESVTVVFDEAGDRRETAVLPLCFSEQYRTLRLLAEKQHQPAAWLEQRELLFLLRNQLCMGGTTFCQQVKKIKIVGSDVRTATVDRGRESLGVEAERDLTDDTGMEFPEQIVVRMPVFEHLVDDNSEFTYTPTVNVDFLAAGPKFRLVPEPGEIRRGLDEAIDWIVGVLIKSGVECPVVIGSANLKT